MPSPAVLIVLGLLMFGAAIALFRVRRGRRPIPSVWTHGTLAGRMALVLWWGAIAFVGMGLLRLVL